MVRIFSARCLGVYVCGALNLDPGAAGAAPHPPQNFTPGSFENPHEGHARANGEPHSAQNRRPGLLAVPQRAQFMASPSSPRMALIQKPERRYEQRPDSPNRGPAGLPPGAGSPAASAEPDNVASTVCRPLSGVWQTTGQGDDTSPRIPTPTGRS
jgi:hypothetical protein